MTRRTTTARGWRRCTATASAVDLEGWLHDSDVFVAEFDERAAVPTDAAGVAEAPDGGPAGGIVGAVQLRRRPERGVLELSRLAVVDGSKERGIGGVLAAHAEAVARERGHDRLRHRSFTGHPVLPDWYERLGYERAGREPLASRPYAVPVMETQL